MLNRAVFAIALLLATSAARVESQSAPRVTSPLEQFGANIGDDYFLATYPQLEAYWKKLDAESDRMQLVDIGRTAEGRQQWMALVSSPENLSRVDRYRDISRRLALAEGIGDAEARALAAEGRAIVWITGGLHANEVLGSQQLIELVYQLVSATDEETRRILRDVIVLAAHANPDGHALVADWYMREPNPQLRTLTGLPRLYHKYVGHDINRDFYLSSQAETININRVLYREWFPQIVYDHHQSAPPGTVMFAPPFSPPYSPFVDALIPESVDLVGRAMHARFAAEGKPGVTMRAGGSYSPWWNGGLRTTAYFHNQIGLLTETIGNPTPMQIPSIASRQTAGPDLPYPIQPRLWSFRESIEYSMTANRAVLDVASRHREELLLNAYRMARRAVVRGTHAYILPSNQPDFLTATKFVDALLKAGVTVYQATAGFEAEGRAFPSGSYLVHAGQAFGAHVLDMFEPQEFPTDLDSDPYDVVGWTLAFQMGVKFDRIRPPGAGPFRIVTAASLPSGTVSAPSTSVGFLFSHHQNDSFVVANRLLAAGQDVYWLADRTVGNFPQDTGAIFVAAREGTLPVIRKAASELGVSFTGVRDVPPGARMKLRRPRIGLWDRYGGAMTSGWIRWLLERYEFAFTLVYAQELDAGDLRSRYDVLILPDDAVPANAPATPKDVPEEYRRTTGAITWGQTLPQLRDFVAAGGTLVLIGDATAIAERIGSGTPSALVEDGPEGLRPLPREKFFIPGSVLRVSVDNTQPLGYGFEREVDVFFERSPAFNVNTAAANPRPVAWFSTDSPLRSGWARGQHYLRGSAAAVEAPLGRGRVLLFGPEITFRAQPHGTFKFLFNGIHYSAADQVQ